MKKTKKFLHRKLYKDETGAVAVVEATIVFPVVIFILIILIVLGNVFYQQSRLDAMAIQAAERLSVYYTHPQFSSPEAMPTTTDPTQIALFPYRYWKSNNDVDASKIVKGKLQNWIDKSDTGMFTGMDIRKARIVECDIKGNIFYHTASVKLQYELSLFPLRLLGIDAKLPIMSTATETAAVDPAEVIRMTDLTVDLFDELDSNFDLRGKLNSALNSFK